MDSWDKVNVPMWDEQSTKKGRLFEGLLKDLFYVRAPAANQRLVVVEHRQYISVVDHEMHFWQEGILGSMIFENVDYNVWLTWVMADLASQWKVQQWTSILQRNCLGQWRFRVLWKNEKSGPENCCPGGRVCAEVSKSEHAGFEYFCWNIPSFKACLASEKHFV